MSNIKPEALKVIGSKAHASIQKGTRATHTFEADFSDVREDFVGKFTVRRPSQLDRLQIGVTQGALLGGLVGEVDVITSNIAYMSATLDVVLVDSPNWFDINDPDIDYDILEAVFNEYLNWTATFRKTNKGVGNAPDSPATGVEVPLVDTNNVEGTSN